MCCLMCCLTGSQCSWLCDSSMACDKLVLLQHLKCAEPYSDMKLASHLKDYFNNLHVRLQLHVRGR